MSTQETKDALEAMVDKASLSSVISWLADIAFAKHDHLQENWRDNDAAMWCRSGRTLGKAASDIIARGL